MAAPTRLNPERLFRPVGNSQPVNLAQYLGPEQTAKILSLGCGDVRNVLFTAYCNADLDRGMDIICCDVEKAVIARNILILSILVDEDATGEVDNALWQLFSNMILDEPAFQVFRKQGRKLRQRSKTLDKWNNCAYGKVIRFCDHESLSRVREVWESYSQVSASDISRFDEVKQKSKVVSEPEGASIELANAWAPFNVTLTEDMLNYREEYWKTGKLENHEETEEPKRYWNPTFSFPGDGLIVHPGTLPIEGFNLTIGYAPLDESSPLAAGHQGGRTDKRCVESMKIQLRAWGDAFSRCCRRGKIILRFVISDALALCQALGDSKCPFPMLDSLSRGPMTLKNMNLDSPDYDTPEDESPGAFRHDKKAPKRFNSIDTSGLADECGAMNVLLVTAPLLDDSIASTLVTEASMDENFFRPGALTPSWIPGDFITMTMLMGLSLVEYWTNNTTAPTSNNNFFMTVQKRLGKDAVVKLRTCWRMSCGFGDMPIDGHAIFRGLDYDPAQLGQLLYLTYRMMLKEVDRGPRTFHYTPATFAALLERIEKVVFVPWPLVMVSMMEKFHEDEESGIVDQDMSEMLVQLHRFGVDNLADSLPLTGKRKAKKEYPVHVTLIVPRQKLECFQGANIAKMGGVSVVCTIKQADETTKRFSVLRLAFGTIHHSKREFGRRAWRLEIDEDPLGWAGESPLLVSFCVPPLVLTDPDTMVTFGLETTPQAVKMFGSSLGLDLALFETNLEEEETVFVCIEPPIIHSPPPAVDAVQAQNQASSPAGPVSQQSPSTHGTVSQVKSQYQAITSPETFRDAIAVLNKVKYTIADWQFGALTQATALFTSPIFARLQSETGILEALSALVMAESEDWSVQLRNGADIHVLNVSPCSVAVKVGDSARIGFIPFPIPIENSLRVEISGEGRNIILTAKPVDPFKRDYPIMNPSFIMLDQITIVGYPYLPLDRLPALDMSVLMGFDVIRNPIQHMVSIREQNEELECLNRGDLSVRQLRSGFKTGMIDMFRCACGFQKGGPKTFFWFHDFEDSEDQFLLAVSAMRLDTGNQSFVMDAAVMSVTNCNRTGVRNMLKKIDGVESYLMLTRKTAQWKCFLAAAVERCRTWHHTPDCKYKETGRVPASFQSNTNFLCSCGHGKLPANFIRNAPPGWDKLKEFAVRAAISPVYSSLLVEPQVPARLKGEYFGPEDLGKPDYRPQCFECGKKPSDDLPTLSSCISCKVATYCARECQVRNWSKHKGACHVFRVVRRSKQQQKEVDE